MQVTICLDEIRFNQKPKRDEIGLISNRVAHYPVTENLKTLANYVGNKGYTFCPAVFKNGIRKKENFCKQQLFAIDFDEGITWELVKQRAEKYNVPIVFAYETFSSTNHNKFRVVFFNESVVYDARACGIIQLSLMHIFPECDKQCSDISRMYFGGKKLFYFNNNIKSINIYDLMLSMTKYFYDSHGEHYLRKIAAFANRTGMMLFNKLLYVDLVEDACVFGNGSSEASSIIYIEAAPRLPKSKLYYAIHFINKNNNNNTSLSVEKNISTGRRDLIRGVKFDNIKCKCKLFDDFYEGSKWLYHEELFGLATNMIQIKGGQKHFVEILKSPQNNKYSSYRIKDWGFYINYIVKREYKPKGCDSFCQYSCECNHSGNLICTVYNKRGLISPLKQEPYYTIEECKKDLEESFKMAMKISEKNVNVIYASTGIGKTTITLNYISRKPKKRFIVAVPSNMLKNQIYNDAINMGIKAMATPSIRELKNIPEETINKINNMYAVGLGHEAANLLDEIYKKNKEPSIENYFKSLEKLQLYDGNIITTHEMLLTFKKSFIKNYQIIIDEDIVAKSLMRMDKTTIKDVLAVKDIAYKNNFNNIYKRAKYIIENYNNLVFTKFKPIKIWEINELKKYIILESITSNVLSLFEANVVNVMKDDNDTVKDEIQYLIKKRLPDQRIIILSATANEMIYKKFFGSENVCFYKCKQPKLKGTILQYPFKSYSRQFIKNNPNIYDEIEGVIGSAIKPITFKEFDNSNEPNGIHFGNSEGHNFMAGRDICVIGTPHKNELCYKMFASALDINIGNDTLRYREVEFNNYKFHFASYESLELREIQLWLIHSELVQCVGRARLLWNNCTAYVFSNLPLQQAIFMSNDIKYYKIKSRIKAQL